MPVLVRAVQDPSDARGARYSGTIEPATRVDVAFKVGGYVRELLQVKGQDGKPRKIQEGDVVSAGAALAVVRQNEYQERVAGANAQLAQALATEKQAQIDYDRTQKLLAENAVPAAEGDTMTSRLASAKALVQSAQAQVRDAHIILDDATLRAPIDGVVLKRAVEAGTFVSPGSPGFSIADITSVKFVFGAPDGLLGKLTLGTPLTVHIDALGIDVGGAITRIAPSADPKSRVFEIEITIPNADGRLKPGVVASIAVPALSQAGIVIALPLTAVVRSPKDPRGFAVFVVTEEGGNTVAHVRDVTLGAVIGNEVQVMGGLQKGELVVTMGATLLVDGMRVRVLPS
ncbi:MAG TPA: efflux RND transporter periplasmic adaptor subunit [Haliangiales bacterium]|nr:efflux RND transporter periplasmic adaptor subunit [Haliangiales bacterium]